MVPLEDARRAVRAALAAAARLHARRDELAPVLAASTGLSLEGVLLGFESLERAATDDDVARLAASVEPAEEAAVILSANVFVAPLRALVLARASAPRVRVRASRREPVFARALVEELGDPAITLEPDLDVAAVRRGVIWIYGRDETVADVRARARVPVLAHGAGMGVALLSAAAATGGSAEAIARDVVAFDQRGCMSPRLVLVEGDAARASAIGVALHEALGASAVPRGVVDPEERAAARRWADTLAMAGELHAGARHAVGVAPEGAPLAVPPPGRHVHVAPFRDRGALAASAARLAPAVVAVGVDDASAPLARSLFPDARALPLGAMQRPPLDGPVDQRRTS